MAAAHSVALAIRNEEFRDSRIFDPAAIAGMRESLHPIAQPWVAVRQRAESHGLNMVTADQVATRRIDPRSVLLIAYDASPASEALLAQGARPALLTTLEPPVIAWSFYDRLPILSARFPHALVFAGACNRLAPGCTPHELRYPVAAGGGGRRTPLWEDRPGYLVMVNSNKAIVRSPARFFDRPREYSLKRQLASRRFSPIGRELYSERLRAIRYFSRQPDFDLFGEGWERRHPAVSPTLHAAALRSYRGLARDKLATLTGYRYGFAFENARFSGYVSEKVFDCLRAGCIPIYYGAPDVARYVPSDAFVDFGEFSSYADLDCFLRSMPVGVARRYVEAGQAYLASPAYDQFSVAAFASEIVGILLDVLVRL